MLIETRRAADLVGATPMDRPEDVEPNPVNGRVYVMLTNNTRRKAEQVDAVNPRAEQRARPGGRAGAAGRRGHGRRPRRRPSSAGTCCSWPATRRRTAPAPSTTRGREAWLSSPDNCAFDPQGRLWISTDQGGAQAKNDIPDGMFACDLDGRRPRAAQVLLRLPGRRRDVRPGVHARTAGRCSSPCSTRPRRTATSRPSRSRRPAGRTSRTACRPGRRSSRSPRTTAARSAADRHATRCAGRLRPPRCSRLLGARPCAWPGADASMAGQDLSSLPFQAASVSCLAAVRWQALGESPGHVAAGSAIGRRVRAALAGIGCIARRDPSSRPQLDAALRRRWRWRRDERERHGGGGGR